MTNVNISKITGTMTEPTIVIDPSNNNRLFAASNIQDSQTAPNASLYTAYSTNAGATWTQSQDFSSAPFNTPCCDSTARADTVGNLFMTYLSTTAGVQATIVKSIDFGQTFSPLSGFLGDDQPHLATGDLKPSGDHLVWMCWVTSTGIKIAGARYTSGTPSSLTAVTAAASGSLTVGGNFGDISIADDGTVMVVYQDGSGATGPSNLYINTIDGSNPAVGLVWNSQIFVTSTNVGGNWGNPQFPNNPSNPAQAFPPQKVRSIDAEVKLAWDRSGGAHNGRVYLAYTDASNIAAVPGASSMNIFIRHSDNKGATWSSPIAVNDTGNNARFFPRVQVDQKTGNVGVAWYDCRNSVSNDHFQSFASYSTDGGLTWKPNILISTGGLSDGNTVNPNDTGDFSDCTYDNNLFYPIWTDNSPACPNYTNGTPGATGGMNILTAKVILCLHPDTLILLSDGNYKRIADLQRGDYVAGDIGMEKIYRISNIPISSYSPKQRMNMAILEPGCLGNNYPFQKTIMTEGHPIFYNDKRRPALCFRNFLGIDFQDQVEGYKLLPISERGTVDLYDLQFDVDGTFVANGLQVQSRCPRSICTPLPKELYFDQSLYRDELTTDAECKGHKIETDMTILDQEVQNQGLCCVQHC